MKTVMKPEAIEYLTNTAVFTNLTQQKHQSSSNQPKTPISVARKGLKANNDLLVVPKPNIKFVRKPLQSRNADLGPA